MTTLCNILISFAQNPCDNDLFAMDTTKKFFISELKPVGNDRFVELYNCRNEDYRADAWYFFGVYSNSVDSILDTIITAHNFLVLTVPYGLWNQDALRVVTRNDTMWSEMYVINYVITDSNKSISFCNWYQQAAPTPNLPNSCEMISRLQILSKSSETENILYERYYDLLGRSVSLDYLQRMNYLIIHEIIYTNGFRIIKKIRH